MNITANQINRTDPCLILLRMRTLYFQDPSSSRAKRPLSAFTPLAYRVTSNRKVLLRPDHRTKVS
jgi:hypothetical protein